MYPDYYQCLEFFEVEPEVNSDIFSMTVNTILMGEYHVIFTFSELEKSFNYLLKHKEVLLVNISVDNPVITFDEKRKHIKVATDEAVYLFYLKKTPFFEVINGFQVS